MTPPSEITRERILKDGGAALRGERLREHQHCGPPSARGARPLRRMRRERIWSVGKAAGEEARSALVAKKPQAIGTLVGWSFKNKVLTPSISGSGAF